MKADLDPLVEEAKTEPIEQPRTVGVTNEETLGEILEMVREQNRILAGRNWEQIWRGSLSAGSYITQGHTLRYIQRQLQLLSEVRDLGTPKNQAIPRGVYFPHAARAEGTSFGAS